jgi:hypothetical protein
MVFDFNLVMGLVFAVTEDVQEFKCQQVHQSSTHLTRSSVKQQDQSKIKAKLFLSKIMVRHSRNFGNVHSLSPRKLQV